MKSTEFRVGNLAYFKTCTGELIVDTVRILKEEDFIKSYHFNFDSPIPLNEEWLIKFGFIQLLKDTFIRLGIKILIEDSICFLCYNNDFIEIEHVHSLQNIFYPLTGEELTLNETL